MKQITRRLYTRPVMIGMAFLGVVALVAALFVTTKSTAAPNSFPVDAGPDEFQTAGDGETFHDFEGSKIPAGFFGQHSLAYGELVPLVGVPVSPGVDTIIQRHTAVTAPGGTTAITMTTLSLKSIDPITVTFNNGVTTWTEQYDMTVGLSAYKSSTGSMKINFSTFDSTLKVWPKFTFTKVGGGTPLVLDTGAPGGPGLTAADSAVAEFDKGEFEPAPAPAPAPAPCKVATIGQFEPHSDSATAAAAASSCAPVTLSSVNSPWSNCPHFCILVPITEEERWARHRPGPRGVIVKGGAVGE
jgi:hypothetical protein